MSFNLLTRVVKSGVVSLEYLPLASLMDGAAHQHLMPVVGPLIRHGHTSAIDPAIYVPAQYVADHTHDLKGFKNHQHTISGGTPLVHDHNGSVTTHKHVVKFEEKVYNYSVTHITGTDDPVITPDVGESARFYIPKADGALTADTTDETIDIALRDASVFADPQVGSSELVGEQTVDGATGAATAPIYARYEFADTSDRAVGTGAETTSSDMHKGVIGESPTVKITTDGENNKLIQLNSTGCDASGFWVNGATDASLNGFYSYSDVDEYEKESGDAVRLCDGKIWNIQKFTGIARQNCFYKTDSLDCAAGFYSNYQHNGLLTVTDSITNPPSISVAGGYELVSVSLPSTYNAWEIPFGDYKIQFEEGVGFKLYSIIDGLTKFKKVTTDFWDATGEYVGVAPVTGSVIVTSTPITGSVSVGYATPPTLSYSKVQAFNPLPHAHDLTVTPTFTDLTHGHIGTADYTHSHMVDVPKHTHEFTPTVVTDHTHDVAITDHSHEPVVAGIWDNMNILSNVTFTRVDDLSPWVLDSVDTVEVAYPRPTVGLEVADVEWLVGKAEDVVLIVESSDPLITDVALTSALAVGIGTEEFETELFSIEDVPYESDAYVAGSPEVAWQSGDKTVAAQHIGVIGEVAGTDEQKSLVSSYDTNHFFVARRDDGVVVRTPCGKLPSGVAHSHTYTDITYNLPNHAHALLVHGYTIADLYLPYDHTHDLIYGYPHTHPDLTDFAKSGHNHDKISCDAGNHTHDLGFIFTDPLSYVDGIDNVVGDTFDLTYTDTAILYPDAAGTDLVEATGIAVVEEADRYIGHLVVSGTITPDMTGSYQLQSSGKYEHDTFLTPPTWAYRISTNGSTFWWISNIAEFQPNIFEKAYDSGNPLGNYTPSVRTPPRIPGTGTAIVSLYTGISIVSVSAASVSSVDVGATATLSGYTVEAGDPLYSGYATSIKEMVKYTASGATAATMTGIVDEKLHSGV